MTGVAIEIYFAASLWQRQIILTGFRARTYIYDHSNNKRNVANTYSSYVEMGLE